MTITAPNTCSPIMTTADNPEVAAAVASARENILSAILELSEVPRPIDRAAYYAQFLALAKTWNTCRQPPARTQLVTRLTSRLLGEIDPVVRKSLRHAIRMLQVDSPRGRVNGQVYLCQLLILREQ